MFLVAALCTRADFHPLFEVVSGAFADYCLGAFRSVVQVKKRKEKRSALHSHDDYKLMQKYKYIFFVCAHSSLYSKYSR